MPSGRIFSSRLGTTGVAEFHLEFHKASALIPAVGGQFEQCQICGVECQNFTQTCHPCRPEKQVIDNCLLVWDLRYETGRAWPNQRAADNIALVNHPSSWGGHEAKSRFTSNGWTTQRQRRPKERVPSPWSESELILIAKIAPYIPKFSGISLINHLNITLYGFMEFP